jgi:hypothetical protein
MVGPKWSVEIVTRPLPDRMRGFVNGSGGNSIGGSPKPANSRDI